MGQVQSGRDPFLQVAVLFHLWVWTEVWGNHLREILCLKWLLGAGGQKQSRLVAAAHTHRDTHHKV